MKKIGALFFVLFFIFPVISALELEMNSQFFQGQTIIASASGNFLDPITTDNIQFYRNHVRTSFDPKVAKIGETYYIYFQSAGKSPNNYSINITGVRYLEGSQILNQQISKSFEIIGEVADFSVSNGFIITEEDFSLKLQNLIGSNVEIEFSEELISGNPIGSFIFEYGGEEVENSINLPSGQAKYINIGLDNFAGTTVREITFSTSNLNYKIPVYIILNESNYNNTNITNNTNGTQTNNTNETINPTNETNTNETSSTNCTWFTKLFGCKETNCTDTCTSLKYSCGNRTICGKITDCGDCSSGEICQTNGSCTITPCADTCTSLKYSCGNRTICGKITDCGDCSSGEICQTNGTCTKSSGSIITKTCAEINGTICPQGQVCANNTVTTKDANCCLSNCKESGGNPNSKLIGWIIILVIGILIFWFFIMKFKKTKKTKDTVLDGKK
ncbi:MAG TPA: hypothetical protein PK357_00815 [Candidatus Pacearchaeota archaeon]|nr:hypothetical protein [Candidatus Pacearchaeota archaeon]